MSDYPLGELESFPGAIYGMQDLPTEKAAHERDYWAKLAQQKADADERRGCKRDVGYYVGDIIGAMQGAYRSQHK